MVKDLALTTNKQKTTINYDVAVRQNEKKLVERLMYIRNKRCTKSTASCSAKFHRTKSSTNKNFRFHELIWLNNDTGNDNIPEYSYNFDWLKAKPPHELFDVTMMKQISDRLFRHDSSCGGIIVPSNSLIHGFTDYSPNDAEFIIRANPYFRNSGAWNDWAFFDWDVHDGLVPAKIYMFLDLTSNTFDYGDENRQRQHNENIDVVLERGKYAVVRSAVDESLDPSHDNGPLTEDHFQSKIAYRIKLEEEY